MLRGFLRLVEDLGGGEVSARDFAEAIANDTEGLLDVLRAEGIVRDAPLARTWPCDGVACARDVRELPQTRAVRGPRRFLAVCTRDPAECEMERVAEGDLAQVLVVLESLLAAAARGLGIEAPKRARLRSTAAGAPVHLGEQVAHGKARDVFFVRRASSPEMRVLLAERANAPRATLVLVPTAAAITPEMAARQAASGHVAIETLADALTVDRGRIAAAPRLHVVPHVASANENASPAEATPDEPRAPARPEPRGPLRELLPRASRWREVTFFNVDDHDKIGVFIAERYAVFTAADLGLSEKKARRRPIAVFRLLTTICDGNGFFVTKKFGTVDYGKRLMSDLRTALREVFGIEDDPFEPYSKRLKCWKPRFRALAASPQEMVDAERTLAWVRGEREEGKSRR